VKQYNQELCISSKKVIKLYLDLIHFETKDYSGVNRNHLKV